MADRLVRPPVGFQRVLRIVQVRDPRLIVLPGAFPL